MAQLNEAYAVLSSPEKRRNYDGLREQFGDDATGRFRQTHTYEDILRESDIEKIFQEIAGNFGIRGFNELFKSGRMRGGGFFMFGSFGPGFSFASRRPHLGSPPHRGKLKHPVGGGFLREMGKTILNNVVDHISLKKIDTDRDIHDTIVLSPSHAEQGGPYAYFHKLQNKKFIVKIPKNIREGRKIRLKGLGREDSLTGEKGDLYLNISIKNNLISRLKKRLLK